MRPILLIALASALLVGCGGGHAQDPTPTPQAIRGTITLYDIEPDWHVGEPCQGEGGYSDLAPGAGVTLKDASGTIIATGRVISGKGLSEGWHGQLEGQSAHCELSFEVTDIPLSDFYSIEIGHRGQITYSAEDLDATGWEVALTLGD